MIRRRNSIRAGVAVLAGLAVLTALAGCGPPSDNGPFGPVAVTSATVVDGARWTPARGDTPAHPGRTLPTTIWYPATGAGPWPLVVFAHGFNTYPAHYDVLLRRWAAAGYVVAAPEFPISGSDFPGPAREDDIPQQPGDLSAVVTFMLGPKSPVAGQVDAARVAAAGHSDGGSAVTALALDDAVRDPRITSYLVLSGAVPYMPFGTYDGANPGPLMVVQGNNDVYNSDSDALGVYASSRPPRAYLSVLGGSHEGPFLDGGPQPTTVRAATAAWLDLTVRHQAGALDRLRAFGQVPGSTSLNDEGF